MCSYALQSHQNTLTMLKIKKQKKDHSASAKKNTSHEVNEQLAELLADLKWNNDMRKQLAERE